MVTLAIILLFSFANISKASLNTLNGNFSKEIIDCLWLKPPENGYFIRGYCSNRENSACVINCNVGYEAYGSTFRQCLVKDKVPYWTGRNTFCHSKNNSLLAILG